MEIKTITYKLFDFGELNEKAKKKALERFSDINTSYDWWDYLYDDALTIGLKLTGFDLYRRDIEGKLVRSIGEVCAAIISNHGKTCKTYKLAQAFYATRKIGKEIDIEDFEKNLKNEYLSLLDQEYDYLISEEAIIEGIEANEYKFLESGKLFREEK